MRYPPFIENDFEFPDFYLVRRNFPRSRVKDIIGTVQNEMERIWPAANILPGQTVAVGVGSRGIADLPVIVKAVCDKITTCGARPVIIPAMGSHGGAEPTGQRAILHSLGIHEKDLGCALDDSMDTATAGTIFDDVPVDYAKAALSADHAVCINRIKPHTKFKADIESGLFKMLAVGLGKHNGAVTYHRQSLRHGFYETLKAMGNAIIDNTNFRFGIGVVENAYEKVMHVEAVLGTDLFSREKELLKLAKSHLATLPVRKLDVLIVGRIGKEISGPGMDTNVTGRTCDFMEDDFSGILNTTRLAVLDLSAHTGGNATGIGNADIITEKAYEKIDYEKTVMNCLTGVSLRKAFIPVRMPNDAKAVQACYTTIGPVPPEAVRAVIIKDTLHLNTFLAGGALIDELKRQNDIAIVKKVKLEFDHKNNLVFPF